MKRAVAFFALLHIMAVGVRAQVAINSATSLLIDKNEPGPVQKAAGDLVLHFINTLTYIKA
jgi:hypothetical protein